MNTLPVEKKVQILNMLVEGSSLRSTSRVAKCSINTVTKLLVDAGYAALEFHNKTAVNLPTKRVEADEIWSFVYSKQANVPEGMKDEAGDVWTWTAIDADSKFMISWLVGSRDGQAARDFLWDLKSRLAERIQLSTDRYNLYISAVDDVFDQWIDFAQVLKTFGTTQGEVAHGRYSTPKVTECTKTRISGQPDMKHASTSYVERQNLTMRMGMRRFTRLTNAFSKKMENHMLAIALHFFNYNFVRVHKTLRVTPAMEIGLTKKPMTLEDLVRLIEQ